MTGGNGEFLWIEGNEGDDLLVGKNLMNEEYIWGGSGNDIIYGGPGKAGDDGTVSVLDGNSGDDIIYPAFGRAAGVNYVHGRKGDDNINPVEKLFDADGT